MTFLLLQRIGDMHQATYRIYPKLSDRQALANKVDTDYTPHSASDLCLLCLLLIH